MVDTDESRDHGRDYLTASSKHAREVHEKQIPSRKIMLERYRYHDGHDGLTFRQFLEVIATLQGTISHGQMAAIAGGFAKWMSEAQGAR
eukprot:15290904-Heterocapsa_arctica.AAC.1